MVNCTNPEVCCLKIPALAIPIRAMSFYMYCVLSCVELVLCDTDPTGSNGKHLKIIILIIHFIRNTGTPGHSCSYSIRQSCGHGVMHKIQVDTCHELQLMFSRVNVITVKSP